LSIITYERGLIIREIGQQRGELQFTRDENNAGLRVVIQLSEKRRENCSTILKTFKSVQKTNSFAGVFIEQGRVTVPVKFGLAISAGALLALGIRALARRR